ncbi:MAG: hypothetical protein IPP57_13805 [Candidatus Obscuribacter sp.]|nr:hypothetical protein [Candidatus Obscuribacter sp.]
MKNQTAPGIQLVAAAHSNDLVTIVAWDWSAGIKIPGCLGFAMTRINKAGVREVIETKLPFDGQDNKDWKSEPSTVWPIQRKWHLDFTGKKNETYVYEIQAMGGTPGNLVPIAGIVCTTNPITLTTKVDDTFHVAFTRGTLSTQWLARMIGVTADGQPDFQKIIDALEDYKNPNNVIRRTLVGNVPDLLMAPINECLTDDGRVKMALYELSANQLVDFLLANLKYFSLILGNTGPIDETNAPARKALHQAGADIHDRMIGSWGIAHNKSQVKLDKHGKATDVTTGSTNWTNTGLGCQSNMVWRIFNAEVAGNFLDYWERLLVDNSQQTLAFRQRNAQGYAPVTLSDGTVIETYFQPSMKDQSKPKGEVPLSPWLSRVKQLMTEAAADGDSMIVGEVFYPGSPSVVQWMAELWDANPELYMFMTVSTPDALRGVSTKRRKGRPPLFTIASGREKEFADFITELLKLPESHAITHGKIVVIINKRTGKYTVIGGSDNLGAKASYGNDENGVIVTGNAKLAWFVFVNMFDINKHYLARAAARASRFFQKDSGYTGRLSQTDSWQDAWLDGYKDKEARMLATGVWDGKGLVDKPGAKSVPILPPRKPKPKVPAADPAQATADSGTAGQTEAVVAPSTAVDTPASAPVPAAPAADAQTVATQPAPTEAPVVVAPAQPADTPLAK